MVDKEFIFVNIVGNIGVALVLIAYFTLTLQLITSHSIRYSLLNLSGSALIGISLFFHFNLPSVIIEVSWFIISFFGLIKALLRNRNNNPHTKTTSEKPTETQSTENITHQPDIV